MYDLASCAASLRAVLCRVARLRLHALARQKRHIWLQLGGLRFASGILHPPDGNFATTLKNSSYDISLAGSIHKYLLSDNSGYSDWLGPSRTVGAEVNIHV